MGFSGLFAVGLSGVTAQSASLEAISNNIANSQTVGFRRERTDFAQLVAQNQTGNVNITGTGVAANARQLVNEQGFINRTSNATDIALTGEGFFIVAENANGIGDNALFTRAGDFRIDSNGNLVNSAGYFLQGQAIGNNGAGAIGSLEGLQTINLANIQGNAVATNALSLSAVFNNLQSISPDAARYNPSDPNNNLVNGSVASDIRQSFTIFDQNGNASQLTLAFLRTGTNQVSVEAFDPASPDGAPIASGVLSFNDNGSLDPQNSTFPATIPATDNNSALNVDLSSLTIGSGASRIINSNSNGAPTGTPTGFTISNDGILSATLSNGESQNLFQIPVALFTNAAGLNRFASTAFQSDPAAGTLTLESAGSGRSGFIEGSALETSTVDISSEFSTLIETQRAYSASARIISIADDLFRTLNETAA